jgi:hypothetical protein
MDMDIRVFRPFERVLAFLAGLFNLVIGFAFFFLPELHLLVWPTPTAIPPVLDRFIGAIILGNAAGALWLSFECEWARVRPLAIVATVYGTLVAIALLYELLWLNIASIFWLYFLFDTPFLIVFYGLFLYHDIIPFMTENVRRK